MYFPWHPLKTPLVSPQGQLNYCLLGRIAAASGQGWVGEFQKFWFGGRFHHIHGMAYSSETIP